MQKYVSRYNIFLIVFQLYNHLITADPINGNFRMLNSFVDRIESILSQIGNSFYDTFNQGQGFPYKR